MRIDGLQITGFGALAGEVVFSPGLNLILAPNEAGKTTLSAALLCLLYGARQLNGKRRLATADERRYRPFAGGSYSLSGTLLSQGGLRLNVWRDLAGDLCRIVDLSTGKDVSSDYLRAPNGDILGQKLLGLTRTQFEKLAVVRRDETSRTGDFAEFSDTLSALLSSEDGEGGTVQQAITALDAALARYSGVTGKGSIRIETEIARLLKRREEIDAELCELEVERARTEAAFAEVAQRMEAQTGQGREALRFEYLAGAARLRELNAQRDGYAAAQARVEEITRQILALAPYRGGDYARGDELAECAALLRDREETRCVQEEHLRRAQARLGLIEQKLQEIGELAHTGEEAVRRADLTAEKLSELERREASARIDLQSAAGALRREGVEPEEAEIFFRWLEGLSADDRRFVGSFSADLNALERDLAAAALARAALEKRRDGIDQARLGAYRSGRANLFIGMALFVAAALAFFLLDMLWFMAIPPFFCLGFSAYALYRMVGAGRLGMEEERELAQEFGRVYAREEEVDRRRAQTAQRREALAEGYPGGAQKFADLSAAASGCAAAVEHWRQVRGRLNELKESRMALAEEWLDALPPGLTAAGAAGLTADEARRIHRELRDALGFERQREKAAAELAQLAKETEDLRTVCAAGRERATGILAAGEIAPGEDGDLARAIALYRERGAKQRRLRTLEDETLPAALVAAAEGDALAALEADLAAAQRRLEKMRDEAPWLGACEPEHPAEEYESLARAARERAVSDGAALAERERAMALELNRSRERIPLLNDEREELGRALERAQRFQKAAEHAKAALERIAGELHARWSPLLAGELNGRVRRFSGKWEFSLSRDLRLGVIPVGGGMPLDEEGLALHLSSGMRDQVYLALRLLLAKRLGAAEPLPLILDDPLVNADDLRFREGMDFLLELAREQQIFLFSCHEGRHRALLADNPAFAQAVVALPDPEAVLPVMAEPVMEVQTALPGVTAEPAGGEASVEAQVDAIIDDVLAEEE